MLPCTLLRSRARLLETPAVQPNSAALLCSPQASVPEPGTGVQDENVLFPGMADLRSQRANGAATDTSAAGAAAAAAKPKGTLSDEDVAKKAQGTFAEFLSIRDYKEAEACIAELNCSEAQEALVVTAAMQVRARWCSACAGRRCDALPHGARSVASSRSMPRLDIRRSRFTCRVTKRGQSLSSADATTHEDVLGCRLALMLKRRLTESRSLRS